MSETASERLEEDELGRPVNQYWTVAAVFGHIAFWDARVLALADKLERGVPLSPSDAEPEDVDRINDASRALIYAIPRHEATRLALQIAEETDARVATLPPDRLWQRDPDNPIYAVLARHRGLHLDEVESALLEDGSQAESWASAGRGRTRSGSAARRDRRSSSLHDLTKGRNSPFASVPLSVR